MKFKIFQLKRVVSLFQGVSEAVKLQMAGSQLAMRALKWGSVFAVVGVSSICFAVWKLSGARSVRCYVFFLFFFYFSEQLIVFLCFLCVFFCFVSDE